MISPKVLARQVEKFALDNAPAILTGIGAIGTATTAYLTAKASFKSAKLLDDEQTRLDVALPYEKLHVMTKTEKVKVVWMEYIPAAASGALTIGAIVCANRVSAKRLAAMVAAYSLSERNLVEYKDKITEKLTPAKAKQVETDIAQDRINNNPARDGQIIITGLGEVTCYDMPSDRYFKSDVEKIRRIQNDINNYVNHEGSAPLVDFYRAMNLKPTSWSDEMGWTTDHPLEVTFDGAIDKHQQPCIAINYTVVPLRGSDFQGCAADPPF